MQLTAPLMQGRQAIQLPELEYGEFKNSNAITSGPLGHSIGFSKEVNCKVLVCKIGDHTVLVTLKVYLVLPLSHFISDWFGVLFF